MRSFAPKPPEVVGDSVDVSVVICTRDRVGSLASTLASLDALVIPTEWSTELVIVDNGSKDGTTAFLRKVSNRLRLRTVVEARPGLSRARNAALAAVRGQAIAWTDDDVIVDPRWLVELVTPILEGRADAVGGRVVIPDELRLLLLRTPLGSRMGFVAATDWTDWHTCSRMVGANMAFGRHVLERVPSFDERLGAGPESLGFHEETLFSWQLEEAGLRVIGSPTAIVHHHFDATRLDHTSILQIARKMGRSTAYVDWHWHHLPKKHLLFLREWRARAKLLLGTIAGKSPEGAELLFRASSSLAYFDEYRRCMNEPRRYRRPSRTPRQAD